MKPIAVYAAFAPDEGFVYDMRYTACNNAFAAALTDAVWKHADDADWSGVYSPLSLQIALQLLANGGDEKTANELMTSLCGTMTREEINASTARLLAMFDADSGVTVNNAVVASKDCRVNADFAETVGRYYNAAIGTLDFMDVKAAEAQINGWISEHTDGLIKELVKDLSNDTVTVLLNTLLLKLEWDAPFTVFRELSAFEGTKGTESVSMMHRTDSMLYGSFDDGEMAVVPYLGGEYAMAVILPAEGVTPAKAASALMGRWNECAKKDVKVIMPKVELGTELNVLELVGDLGIADAVRGNYSNLLTGNAEVTVTQIVQGARLEVTENGTVAAAATAIVANKGLPAPAEFTIECNRPYAMVIYNVETGTVLFVSIVNNI